MRNPGFTLIEILIVVAIIGLVAAIAYPSYRQYVLETRRSECASSLMQLASALERFRTANNRYDAVDTSGDMLICASGNPPCAPANTLFTDRCPADGSDPQTYDLRIDNATANTFTLAAEPVSGKVMKGDPECGDLTYDSTGRKAAEFGTVEECW
jgi:type IV pilus assembly protein PilE